MCSEWGWSELRAEQWIGEILSGSNLRFFTRKRSNQEARARAPVHVGRRVAQVRGAMLLGLVTDGGTGPGRLA